MLLRFCLYSVLKNLRFADPFLVLFLLDLEYSFAQIGLLLGLERLLTGLLGLPLLGLARGALHLRLCLGRPLLCLADAFGGP